MTDAERVLPLFPLDQVVLYPGMSLPLRIFEPRYKVMIGACQVTDQLFGVLLIRSGSEVGAPAEPERVVVVLRRHERTARRKCSVDVRVHEVRVDEVRPELPQRAAQGDEEPRVEIPWRAQAHRRHSELPVERLRVPGRVVEADERYVDAALGERREQRQEVPLGSPDPAHPMDVNDLQRSANRCGAKRSHSQSTPPAASSAMRKSHGAR